MHEFIYRNGGNANLPFELKIKMPKPDQGKRGYSKAMIADYAKPV